MIKCLRERQRERERDTHTHTQKEREKRRESERARERAREREREREREIERARERERKREREKERERRAGQKRRAGPKCRAGQQCSALYRGGVWVRVDNVQAASIIRRVKPQLPSILTLGQHLVVLVEKEQLQGEGRTRTVIATAHPMHASICGAKSKK